MKSFPYSTDRHKPGTWKIITLDGEHTVVFICSECKTSGYLTEHEISADGTVTPSVVCNSGKNCSFHEFIKLENWEEYNERY